MLLLLVFYQMQLKINIILFILIVLVSCSIENNNTIVKNLLDKKVEKPIIKKEVIKSSKKKTKKKIISKTNKIPFYFSVDFEDFYHDKKRQLGHSNPDALEKPLWKSYEKIKKICENLFSNKKITFFSTGILAKKAPDLLSNIAKG